MPRDRQHILRLGEREVPEVVDVLCDAFADYPVMKFVLRDSGDRKSGHLRRITTLFVMSRVLRKEFIFGISEDDDLQAVALVSRPSGPESPPELGTLREEVWRDVGSEARARYESYGVTVAPFMDPTPHLHLNMIGVRAAAQGKGYARQLLEHVHEVSRNDPDSSGVSLTTETEANVPLYEHFGYRVIGKTEIAPGLTCWGFFRPNAE